MKMKINKKKVLVLVAMVLLLVATGVLNWALNNNLLTDREVSGEATIETFFSAYRTDRSATREEEFLYLDAILASENSSETAKTAAETQKIEITQRMENELVLEGLVKAKGFPDAVVTMTSSNVNVVVNTAELTPEQAAQIYDIITSETSYTASNVRIIPYN
ncbi:MAG: SpoIIIAH-like family protein [Clostridia bacterium]|nr:SpoIIIAH-like family protein [Clostridia bacterium]